MPPRYTRRLALLAVAIFVAVGLFIVEQRPQHSLEPHAFPSLYNLVHEVQEPLKEGESAAPHSDHDELELDPCTVLSPHKGFIDLRGLSVVAGHGHDVKQLLWSAKGYDSGHNYTVGVCLGAIKRHLLPNVEVVDSLNASQVGAYYIDQETGRYILMGQVSTRPMFKGKKLTLTYENGSNCNGMTFKDGTPLRRRTILTFTCDRDMLTKAHVSYVAAVDECTYFFEVRSHLACPTAAKADNLAAIWIFVLILLAALLVYLSGGIFYKALKQRQSLHS
uniref:MRH domain-containing protein n=1 Tax=Candidozyma auris TaxID=498019 RepID=A0A0L0NYT3_CANAR